MLETLHATCVVVVNDEEGCPHVTPLITMARLKHGHPVGCGRNWIGRGCGMEPPPRVAGARVTTDWGYYGPRMVESSAVATAEWSLGDRRLILLVNTTHLLQEITLEPGASASASTWLRSLDPSTLHKGAMSDKLELRLPPYAIEALLITPDGPPEDLAGALAAVSTFADGMGITESFTPAPDREPDLPETGVRVLRIEAPYSNIHLAEVEINARLVLLGEGRKELFSTDLRPFARKPVISFGRPGSENSRQGRSTITPTSARGPHGVSCSH